MPSMPAALGVEMISDYQRRAVLRRAYSAWLETITDPSRNDTSPDAERCRRLIIAFIRGEGLGWEWQGYAGNGAFAWCGAFAAYCWRGLVRKDILYKRFASTIRLREWGEEERERQVGLADILPGDIVTVLGRSAVGEHITIAVARAKDGSLVTVEGNAHGRLPDGRWAEGVVMNVRPASELRAAYRPIETDLLPF